MQQRKHKVIVIVGPTASGKTKLAVALARQFNGEIVSADSRQVYRGMDVGTGKDLGQYQVKLKIKNQKLKFRRVSYHLIDVVSPRQQFTVADYQRKAYKAIDEILSRGKLPIVCGGTGLYIAAVTQGYLLPQNQKSKFKNQNLRKRLSKLTLRQLLARLRAVDPKTYKIIDQKNRRRVERALEIYYQTGQPKSALIGKRKPNYDFLLLGVALPKKKLYENISRRLRQRLQKEGMVNEVKRLHQKGISWQRLDDFGLEYRYISRYLRNQLTYDQMIEQLKTASQQFAKRQMTWFKRDTAITWVMTSSQAKKIARNFLD